MFHANDFFKHYIDSHNEPRFEAFIKVIDAFPADFYLTGSMFFGKWNRLSGIDIFVMESFNVRYLLNSFNFSEYLARNMAEEHSLDLSLSSIFSLKKSHSNMEHDIHIQFVKGRWLEAKIKAQKTIDKLGLYHLDFTKEEIKKVWPFVMSYYKINGPPALYIGNYVLRAGDIQLQKPQLPTK